MAENAQNLKNGPIDQEVQKSECFVEVKCLFRTGTGRSELAISVGRKQLGAQLECKADNEAVPSPLTSAIQVQKINLTRMRIIFFTNFLHFSWTSL